MTSTAIADVYGARVIKRRTRATKAEMEHRRATLMELAREAAPTSVRHLYYRSVAFGMVSKDDSGYRKVQREVLKLRRDGVMPWQWVEDPGRSGYWAHVYNNSQDALAQLSQTYRRNPWPEWAPRVEIWCESESLAGVLKPIRNNYAVTIFPTGGQTSDTLAHNAATEYEPHSHVIVLYAGDYDPAGLMISSQIEGKLRRHADPSVTIEFRRLAINAEQALTPEMQALGTPPKTDRWRDFHGDLHPFIGLSVESEAIDADVMRRMFAHEIEAIGEEHCLRDIFTETREMERIEREQLAELARVWSQ